MSDFPHPQLDQFHVLVELPQVGGSCSISVPTQLNLMFGGRFTTLVLYDGFPAF